MEIKVTGNIAFWLIFNIKIKKSKRKKFHGQKRVVGERKVKKSPSIRDMLFYTNDFLFSDLIIILYLTVSVFDLLYKWNVSTVHK